MHLLKQVFDAVEHVMTFGLERLAKAARKDDGPGPDDAHREQAARARRAKQDKAKVVAINSKEEAA